ncbi:MAG: hypothetical protein GX579_00060 [Chloroflexi bacterium]|nr:hypothetical protein [Chloroflexota bacterium]
MRDSLDRDRLSIVSAALLLTLAFSRLVDVPVRQYELPVFGSPLGLTLSGSTLLLLLAAGLGATGMQSLLQGQPGVARPRRATAIYWILPALLGAASVAWLGSLDDLGDWTLAMLGALALVPLTFAWEYAAAMVAPATPEDGAPAPYVSWRLLALVLLVGLISFYTLVDARLRLLAGGPLLFGLATLLAARLFWVGARSLRPAFTYAAVAGFLLVQLYWLLSQLPLSSIRGGMLLLLAFYVIAGLLQQLQRGGWSSSVAREYGLVGLLGLVLIFLLTP